MSDMLKEISVICDESASMRRSLAAVSVDDHRDPRNIDTLLTGLLSPDHDPLASNSLVDICDTQHQQRLTAARNSYLPSSPSNEVREAECDDKDVDEEGRGVTVRLLDPFATRLTVLVDMPRRGREFCP